MLSTPATSSAVESRRGAQHAPVTFVMPFDPGYSVQHLEPRLPNLYFTRFDIIRVQTFIEIEFRFLCEQSNPSPEFIFSRLVKALQAQGRVNSQIPIEIEDEWQFFLSDRDRA